MLGAVGTTVAAPGGAQKVVDAVSNSDPDLLTRLAGAVGGGNVRALGDGANLLGGMLGGSGLSSLVGALSQYAGAPQPAAQSTIGTVVQAAIGTLGQQDPSNWSNPASIAALFGSQKDAIAAALPAEISRALGATGLLAGLGGLGVAAARTAGATASARERAVGRRQGDAPPPTARSRRLRRSRNVVIWVIIALIVIVLAAVWWFMIQNQKAPSRQRRA